MVEQIDPRQQHLDDHYGDLGLTLVDEPTGGSGAGLDPKAARAFLRGLRPVAKVKQTLAQVAGKAKR